MNDKLRKMIYAVKVWCYHAIKATGAEGVYRFTDNLKFRKLGRKPPELMWKALPRCPHIRYDAGGVQMNDKLYAICGFSKGEPQVLHQIDVFDLKTEKWTQSFDTPKDMATSHLAITHDGQRYIYFLGGQVSINCAPATRKCFVFDVQEKIFSRLPDLPEERYSLNAQLWNGRIHVVGGSKPDRCTPATDHWSIGIDGHEATETEWKTEQPSIPRGGPHRGSVIYENRFITFGGQEGDVIADEDDPMYFPQWHLTKDIIYPDLYALGYGEEAWSKLEDMPQAVSHTEFSLTLYKDHVILVGGQTDRLNDPHKCLITDKVQAYNLKTGEWKILGRTPYAIKTPIVGMYNGWLYITTGQAGKGVSEPDETGSYDCRTWKVKIEL